MPRFKKIMTQSGITSFLTDVEGAEVARVHDISDIITGASPKIGLLQGEELVINRAIVHGIGYRSGVTQFSFEILGLIHTGTFTSPTESTTQVTDQIVNDAIDNDFEFESYGVFPAKTLSPSYAFVNYKVDITKFARKIAKQIIYSAALATNPVAVVAIICRGSSAVETFHSGWIEIDYIVRPRVARILSTT